MNKIQSSNEKVGDSNEEEIVVTNKLSGIPGDHENAAGNDDRKQFSDIMKEKVVIEAGEIESDQGQQCKKEVGVGFIQ
jgi:hypothetical protein